VEKHMSDTQRVYDNLPVETLLSEEQRVHEQIELLHERSQMIARAILQKYVTPDPARLIDKWID
jgi:hypothetical protein